MKLRLGLFVLLGSLITTSWAVDQPVTNYREFTGRVDPVQVCMMKRTIQQHTSYRQEFEGKTYHFCCSMCLGQFNANPAHAKLVTDPVNHKQIDKAEAKLYAYQGRAYFFSSERTLKKFAKKPAKYRE